MSEPVEDVIARLRAAGFRLWVEGDQIRFRAPAEAGDSADLEILKACKADAVAWLSATGNRGALPPLTRQTRQTQMPLSSSQHMWFPMRPSVRKEQLRFILSFRLEGALATPVLEAAFRKLIERHEILRTSYAERDGRPWQAVSPESYPVVEFHDLSGLSEDTLDKKIWSLTRDDQTKALEDFASGRVIHAYLLRLNPREHILRIGVTHIAFDPRSATILARDLFRLYQAELTGDAADLPDLPLQYADYALWESNALNDTQRSRNDEIWDSRLKGLVSIDLAPVATADPDGRPQPPTMAQFLPMPEWENVNSSHLIQLARSLGSTPAMIYLGLAGALLGQWTGQSRVLLGYVVDTRPPGLEELIGCFSRIRPFALDVSGEPTVQDLAHRARMAFVQGANPDTAPTPGYLHKIGLGQVMINLIPQTSAEATEWTLASGLTVGPWTSRLATRPLMTPQLEVRLNLWDHHVNGHLSYASGKVDDAKAQAFARMFPILTARALAEPDQPVSALMARV